MQLVLVLLKMKALCLIILIPIAHGLQDTKEDYTRNFKGNQGISATYQAMIKQFRENIRAVDYEIITELQPLFMRFILILYRKDFFICLLINYFYTQLFGGLPTAYINSLSFQEQLLLFNKKLNEIIDVINELDLDKINDLINQAINDLKQYVDKQDNLIYNYINNQIENLKNYTDNQNDILYNDLISLLNQKIDFIINYVNTSNNILKNELFKEIEKLNEKIDNIVLSDFKIFNPTTRCFR